jgi:exodeoxyribonuclease-5
MLVGDTAQLPPVHFDTSPALDADHLKYRFRREVYQTELTEVVRQKNDSGILYNATHIREHIREEDEHIEFDLNGYNDIVRVTGNELVDLMHTVYKEEGKENVLLITRSNKSAIQYNRLIRFNQMWMENEIDAGDQLMVVKNNYHWIDEEHPANFIANGDIIEVRKIHRFEDVFNCRFALATIKLNDYPDEPAIEAYLLLDTLSSEGPALTKDQQNKLYNALQDYYAAEEPDKRRRSALIRKDPYYNALQVKFAYAVTCHKSQGGQWPVVFVDQGYFTEDMLNIEYLRWLYTAITRASKKVYLLNFSDSFFQS